MNGTIAQLAALCCHANAFLSGREFPPLFPDNSSCRYCARIEFLELEPNPSGEPLRRRLAANPDEWIHALPLREVDGVLLTALPRNDPNISDRLSAGFIGGGRGWQIAVLRDDAQTEIWTADWQIGNRKAPDRRIWNVDYRLQSVQPRVAYRGHNLAVVKQGFHDRLAEILDFARQHTDGSFIPHFEEALSALDSPAPDNGYYDDIALPGQLGDGARSLLQAATRAWVFGGMGTWNDMSFAAPLQTRYENVSDGLFEIIHEAIETAIASTYLSS